MGYLVEGQGPLVLPDVPGDLDGGLICLDLHADLDDVEWLAWAYQQCSLRTAADICTNQ